MKRYLQLWLMVAGLCAGCSKSSVVSPREFTQEYAAMLREARPGLSGTIVQDLELKVAAKGGHEATAFLHNAYDAYKQDPPARTRVIQSFIAAGAETLGGMSEGIDRARVVPVIKDRPWI